MALPKDYQAPLLPIIGVVEREIRRGHTDAQIDAYIAGHHHYSWLTPVKRQQVIEMGHAFNSLRERMDAACREGGISNPDCVSAIGKLAGDNYPYLSYTVKVQVMTKDEAGNQYVRTIAVTMSYKATISQLLSRVLTLCQDGTLRQCGSDTPGVSGNVSLLKPPGGSAFRIIDVKGNRQAGAMDVGLGDTLEPIKEVRQRLTGR